MKLSLDYETENPQQSFSVITVPFIQSRALNAFAVSPKYEKVNPHFCYRVHISIALGGQLVSKWSASINSNIEEYTFQQRQVHP